MTVKLLTEMHVEYLSLKVGCTGSSESTLVKMPHCWESHVVALRCFCYGSIYPLYMGSRCYGVVLYLDFTKCHFNQIHGYVLVSHVIPVFFINTLCGEM